VALLFFSKTDRDGKFERQFRAALKQLAPEVDVRIWPDVGNARRAPDLPKHVPIYRLVEGGMSEPMSEYVLYGVLQAQRQMQSFADAQTAKQWMRGAQEPTAAQWQVGILGAGVLASAVATRLVANGYSVRTWSRTLNQEFFSKLPKGTSLINAARGEHCVDNDLIAALDSGQISSALLDVFHQEPLPDTHPFWSHPRIQITPHIAAPTAGDVAATQVAKGVSDAIAGQAPAGLVDRSTGY